MTHFIVILRVANDFVDTYLYSYRINVVIIEMYKHIFV